MQKIRKILRANSEKTALPTNQLLPRTPISYDLAGTDLKISTSETFCKNFSNIILERTVHRNLDFQTDKYIRNILQIFLRHTSRKNCVEI